MTPIEKPWVIIHEVEGGKMETVIAGPLDDHRLYGLLIADLVRHVAKAFGVHETQIWEWVDKERAKPSTILTRTGLQ